MYFCVWGGSSGRAPRVEEGGGPPGLDEHRRSTKKKCFASQNGQKRTLSSTRKMKANENAESFQPIEFSLSKFGNLDPTYQTSKARIR